MFDNLIIFGAQYLIWGLVVVAAIYIASKTKEKQRKILILGIIILPVSYIAAKIWAYFYYDPRPFVENNFIPLIAHSADNGFPSDHTLFGAAIASVIFIFNKKTGIVLFVLTLLVGFSRVLAGVHHSVDILSSLLIAVIIACLVYLVVRKGKSKF